MQCFVPTSMEALCDIVVSARDGGTRLEIRGGGTKAAIGVPREAATLDMRGFSGIVDYDPAELVLTAGAGTPLAEIEAAVAANGQMLAFEPWDHGPLFGTEDGSATLGGVMAAGVAGPRRVVAGAPRDHLLGFEAVSGRGERFVAGGKVVKNVTGFDLGKLMAGSWGRLAAMTQLSIKVLPAPRVVATLAAEGLGADAALALMMQALGSPADVSGAAHGRGRTLLRVAGFGPSVEERCAGLIRRFAGTASFVRLPGDEARAAWASVRVPAALRGAVLWRIQLPAAAAALAAAELDGMDAEWSIDWGGSLVWAALDATTDAPRALATRLGGHAMLVRGPAEMRAAIPAQQPRQAGVAALEARVRAAFDPAGVFDCGRF